MNPSNLFKSEGLATLARYVAPDTLFAFDLDGTLAPIVADYTAAKIDEPMRITLERLVQLVPVAVITGRSRHDARAILGFEPQLLVGNHGAEWPTHNGSGNALLASDCRRWRDHLQELLAAVPGVEIEFKGESISLHYRNAVDQEQALATIDAALGKLIPAPRRIGGKLVVNLLPMDAATKGEALETAMKQFGAARAIFFGDDETDEQVFQLTTVDLFGVHIGTDRETAAPYNLNSQSELLGLLNSLVGILETRGENEDPQ